jgi:N6-adenosine-specific RNA methylase IME4
MGRYQTIVADPPPTAICPSHSGSLTPAEYILVAAKGSPAVGDRLPGSVFSIPKPYKHSLKPEAFLDYIEQVSPEPRLEMFARRARFGWEYWGDQSLGTVEMPSNSPRAA